MMEFLVDVDVIRIAAPVAALIAGWFLFYEGFAWKVGSDGRFWRAVRSVLPMFDEEARERGFYTSYEVGPDEIAGVWTVGPDEAARRLQDLGGIDSPAAAHKSLKTVAGETTRRECGSFGFFAVDGHRLRSMPKALRFLLMAAALRKQDPHITLFPIYPGEPERGLVVTAHSEYSPYNFLVAYKHLRAKNYDIERGVERSREILDDEEEFQEVVRGISSL